MSILNENPSVVVKRKNIQQVFDYCLDNRIEFKTVPRSMQDEWDVEFMISDIMKAVTLGMFLKENKLELTGFAMAAPKAVPAAKPRVSKKSEKEESVSVAKEIDMAPVSAPVTSSFQMEETAVAVAEELAADEDIFAVAEPTVIDSIEEEIEESMAETESLFDMPVAETTQPGAASTTDDDLFMQHHA